MRCMVLIPGVVVDCDVGGCTCVVYVGGGCSGVVTVVWRVVVVVNGACSPLPSEVVGALRRER
jgi:hypothetical protein